MVQLFYQYCIANNVLKKNAPFLTLNCAQYANNPELLTSNLFGYAKGAFTGAEEDYDGLFKSADGGLLFLDEVHRLNAEGQEKLFTYMDQGVIQRIGETAKSQSVNVRLAFATTEDLQSTFLTTFIRRIPIQVKLPTLSQ
ncbi:transcriptional antiterminator bglG, sigma-54 factor, interaction region [Melissococcus plutonius ATCC 35311]|uniref:Transcriptional antiterminator bglG, sigma-54 factor, interaction region n=2 Tax=Melissococcus plutonius TaxID=33970 RepID=F3Y9C8_MELPT|nr:sigma-54 dependent transcriptional regulator of gfr operon [Melissococcus plutonius]BAK21106.1 transcriptional antiterminator bglG, sigma-54 factor, interaction region [Melissococcus plutonius ATCC 35311]